MKLHHPIAEVAANQTAHQRVCPHFVLRYRERISETALLVVCRHAVGRLVSMQPASSSCHTKARLPDEPIAVQDRNNDSLLRRIGFRNEAWRMAFVLHRLTCLFCFRLWPVLTKVALHLAVAARQSL